MTRLILASTSPSRKKVLTQLSIPFECVAPVCDETPLKNESAQDLVLRLSEEKARSIAQQYPDAIVIGSDQVALFQGQILGKPHTVARAIEQLRAFSGERIDFFTGLSVQHHRQKQCITTYEPFSVVMRSLTDQEIDAYVSKEMPLQCAGSFKCDALGITLFERLEGNDLNALIGLPLIRLNQLLISMGHNPLFWPTR